MSAPTPSTWQQSWLNLQQAIQQASPIGQATVAQATAITNAVQILSAQVQLYLASLAPLDPKIVPTQQFLNELNLIARNVQVGESFRTTSVQGVSLARTATLYYGDPSLGVDLAEANGLPTTRISDTVYQTIILPPFPSSL